MCSLQPCRLQLGRVAYAREKAVVGRRRHQLAPMTHMAAPSNPSPHRGRRACGRQPEADKVAVSIRRRSIIVLRPQARRRLETTAAPLSTRRSVVIFCMMKFFMRASLVKRLVFALTAVALVFATMQANCVDATGMQDKAAMTAPMATSCSDCADKAPAGELAKMACGALACAGILGLPARQMICLPDFGKYVHPLSAVEKMTGISLAPDPFPPRPPFAPTLRAASAFQSA